VEISSTAGQTTDENMAHAHCAIDNRGYKHTPSQRVIFIAFPPQQCLHENASMLRYMYIASLGQQLAVL